MEHKTNLFRRESMERVQTPEQLDQYIRVSRVSVWVLIFALLLLVISVMIWGITGSLPQTVKAKGVVGDDGRVNCYLNTHKVHGNLEGCSVQLTMPDGSRVDGYVVGMSNLPFSYEEVAEILNRDWLVDQIVDGNYEYQLQVEASGSLPKNVIVDAVITTGEIKPMEYVLN